MPHAPNQAAGAPVEITIFFKQENHAFYLPLGESPLGKGVGTIGHKGLARGRGALAELDEPGVIWKNYTQSPHKLRASER